MEAKNTGAVIFTILFILFCAVVGSCFMAFVYPTKKITIENPNVLTQTGIVVSGEDGQAITKLNLSTQKLGLKPATGEEDDETEIPTTVTDKQGSEGQYATFKLTSTGAWKLYVTNINIESENDTTAERENIKVGLKGKAGSTKTLEGDKILVASGDAITEPQEFTFFVWLHASAGNDLVGATISFDLSFENAN